MNSFAPFLAELRGFKFFSCSRINLYSPELIMFTPRFDSNLMLNLSRLKWMQKHDFINNKGTMA
jgi:hypothetical protein